METLAKKYTIILFMGNEMMLAIQEEKKKSVLINIDKTTHKVKWVENIIEHITSYGIAQIVSKIKWYVCTHFTWYHVKITCNIFLLNYKWLFITLSKVVIYMSILRECVQVQLMNVFM